MSRHSEREDRSRELAKERSLVPTGERFVGGEVRQRARPADGLRRRVLL
jgi:hypothetical protein